MPVYCVKLEEETWKPCDGSCEEGYEILLAYSGILGALGQEILVFGISVEFFTVVSLCKGVMFDVVLVWLLE